MVLFYYFHTATEIQNIQVSFLTVFPRCIVFMVIQPVLIISQQHTHLQFILIVSIVSTHQKAREYGKRHLGSESRGARQKFWKYYPDPVL